VGCTSYFVPDYGDVVLAEYTHPFNQGDITCFDRLYQRTALALGTLPRTITCRAGAIERLY
jgi:hypothetical protein